MMIIYKSMSKSLNKSITINNKTLQKWSLCYAYDVAFSIKFERPVGGGFEN